MDNRTDLPDANLENMQLDNAIKYGSKSPLSPIEPESNISESNMEMNDIYKVPNISSDIPVDINFNPNSTPFFTGEAIKSPLDHIQKPGAGFIKSVGQAFKETNDFALILGNDQDRDNPLYDPVKPNWNPKDELSNFTGIPDEYKGYILKATGPKDQVRRYHQVLDMMQKDEEYSDGSMLGHLIGGLAGAVTSPTSWIPIAGAVKYSKLSTSLLENIPKMLPGISASAMAHEALVQTTKTAGNLEDFVVDSIRDIAMGTAFMGTATGLGYGWDAMKLWNARKAINLIYKGVDIVPVVAKDGSVTHFKAVSDSLSAAQTNFADFFVNSSMAKNGLFGVPYIGNLIGKGAGKINPIIRGLNSRFETMRGFTDRIADHGIETEGNVKGIESPEKYEIFMAKLQGDNKTFEAQLRAMHLERNGIKLGNQATNFARRQVQKWSNPDYVSEAKFVDEINDVIISGKQSPHAPVNNAADLTTEKLDSSYKAFREAYNLPEEYLPPKTAKGYLNRVFDVGYMELHESEWNDMVVMSLKDSDATINSFMQPIYEMQDQVKTTEAAHQQYIRTAGLTSDQIKASADKLIGQQRQLKKMKEAVQDSLRSNEDLRMHVDDVAALSAKEAKALAKLTKPLRKMKKEVKAVKARVDEVKFEILKARGAAAKAKTKDIADKYIEKADAFEKELPGLEAEARTKQDAHDIEHERLQQLARDGKVNKVLYDEIPGSGQVKFKKTSDRLKFRPVYESEFHMLAAAKAYYRTILNQTAEDTIQQVMGRLMGRMAENPLNARTLMIPDHVLYSGNFLSKDLAINTMNYRNALGRKTFLKNVFKDVTIDGGIQPIAERLTAEFEGMKAPLNEKIDRLRGIEKPTKADLKELKQAEKDLNDLQKDFNSNKEDMRLSYEKMMGRTRGSEKMREFSSITRSFAVAVKLGMTPLTMVTDMMAIAFKHGLWPQVRDGLLPMLKNISELIKTGKGGAYTENAAHAHLATSHMANATADSRWNGSAQPYIPVMKQVANGMETMAHISNNISGTNYVDNWLQRWTASVIQSKIVKSMLDFKAGKLSEKDKSKLLIYGLKPEDWADRIIEGWKSRGSDGNGFGGYQSRYWEWADLEASNKFSDTIFRGTRDTIIRKGMFDAPFALDDPLIGTMYMFKGWVLASLTRYLTPLMQKPDAEKLIGTMLMLGAGAMVTPLRRIAKGEDPIQKDDNMFWNAMVDGGVFSSITDTLEHVNVLMGGNLLKDIKNDRYRDRSIAGFLGGPAAGITNDLVHIIRMASSGNWNQNDVDKMARLIPIANTWETRALVNKTVESLRLPKTYAEAERH